MILKYNNKIIEFIKYIITIQRKKLFANNMTMIVYSNMNINKVLKFKTDLVIEDI